MKKSDKRSGARPWKVLASVFCVLLVLAIVATAVANHFSTSINAFLLCDTYKIVSTGEGGDTDYFPDEWAGYGQVTDTLPGVDVRDICDPLRRSAWNCRLSRFSYLWTYWPICTHFLRLRISARTLYFFITRNTVLGL